MWQRRTTPESSQDKNYRGISYYVFITETTCLIAYFNIVSAVQISDVKICCVLKVLHSPFDDIVPREIKKAKKEKDKDEGRKSQSKATKWVPRPHLSLWLQQTSSCCCRCYFCFFLKWNVDFDRNFSLLSFGEEAEEEEEVANQVSQVLNLKTAVVSYAGYTSLS